MSLSLKPPRPSVQWLDEPELAFAGGLTHIDPKVGIPASGPWSQDHANHPASVTAGFIGTAERIATARAWLALALAGHVDSMALEKVALAEGMTTMADDGAAKCRAGVTTIDEVFRVTASL